MNEEWKDVVGYEGIYEVSSLGRVRTHKDKTTCTKNHVIKHWKQRYLRDKSPKNKYVRIALWKNGICQYVLVHRLVAIAFIPSIKGKNFVNHIDGNTKNNKVSNLEWCTSKENTNHAFEHNLMKTNFKVKLIQLNSGIRLEFISFTRASKWLKRDKSYISKRLERGYKTVIAKDGSEYRIEKMIECQKL
ncbi:NUMOD4 motif-containing HNH endonuclease [Staphylococcus haemolyticus]|mgnify:FL=1|uniref:NUMOD4 motif-containing HNH endonuclease n=1 Tax=Staphylococcus haemolyticus TaxID=1283 RepID=UPI00051D42CA|nr:NUMOD4 motif-containing HNH endonuclease [Staphylococcus haemolyticus]KGJ25358.1 HNH endonuclease [Staphylococcus haemolyticus]KGJ29256.1 HNH endonuclease [Staphylococcus haemolyticus]MCH4326196.1 NUMOD4 motif-containing HNH endonuclease [Staphylococcus haemolyticus]MCH4414279.1 NUMOD4 motif-containing HNH endonuclease [Staphylococcus haemolyticus]MCH4419089.1 NUMOD4 motif-containing HNH endonuclease [Staphylococcus haemolyticus]